MATYAAERVKEFASQKSGIHVFYVDEELTSNLESLVKDDVQLDRSFFLVSSQDSSTKLRTVSKFTSVFCDHIQRPTTSILNQDQRGSSSAAADFMGSGTKEGGGKLTKNSSEAREVLDDLCII
ncbi:hypothetical protein F8388_006424 [Cannabis sativa]|uniref:Uncharacterized protein n=1 Tax=Cannabis sativa TaxID=3483 RepID=A0A7J6F8W9_CANSA|nr:hypothetical protein F8388_006424 [Cannabis sativa]